MAKAVLKAADVLAVKTMATDKAATAVPAVATETVATAACVFPKCRDGSPNQVCGSDC